MSSAELNEDDVRHITRLIDEGKLPQLRRLDKNGNQKHKAQEFI